MRNNELKFGNGSCEVVKIWKRKAKKIYVMCVEVVLQKSKITCDS
jgi:hypothetical protein